MPAPADQGRGGDRRWWVLAGACCGLTVLMLDSTVVNVALPVLRRDLDATTVELGWIPNAYLLVLAALVVTMGRLGDILGRRRVFLVGLTTFGLGSILGGAAQSPEMVIAARAVMGVGAACTLPLSLTLVNDAFPPEQRGRAMGLWAAVSSLALALGPILGGILAEADWRLIFWMNLPIVIAGFLVTRSAAAETRDETSTQRIDFPGVLLLSAGLGALTIGFAQAEDWGWGAPDTLGLITFGLLTLVAFWIVEHRVDEPIVDFALFRNKPYFGASAAAFALVGAYWVVVFFFPQFLQDVLDYSPAEAGLLILPVTLPMVLISVVADRFVKALGPRIVMGSGMLAGLAGLILMGTVDGGSDYLSVFPGFLLFGIALGFVYAPMQTAAMAAMPQAKAGIASGVLAMNRVLSGALSLAITGSLFHTVLRERIETEVAGGGIGAGAAGELEGLANGTPSATAELSRLSVASADAIVSGVEDAFTYALSTMLWFPIAVTAIGAVLTWAYVRAPGDGSDGPAPEVEVPPHHRHRGRFHL
jgi:EmrB/QacA subfamily drug resistance transporter